MDAYALLSAERPAGRVAAVARVALSQRDPPAQCPRYREALEQALRDEPPPFAEDSYRDVYRAASSDGQWLAISLIANAEREGDGATRLWSLSACSRDEEERQLLKRHAVDESSHSLAYLALLDLAFAGALEPAFRAELNQLSPGYSMGQTPFPVEGSPYAHAPSLDDYVQMNIAEIRTTLHHLMQRVALAAHCPEANQPKVTRLLDSLLRDELSHVSYTAVLIDKRAQAKAPEELHALFRRRLRDFNEITRRELGRLSFE